MVDSFTDDTTERKRILVSMANPFPVMLGDSSSVDAFGRGRVANPVNLFLNKNVHDKNVILWEEPQVGVVIVHGVVTSGPFQVGEDAIDDTTGLIGEITAVAGDNLSVTVNVNHNNYTPTGGLTGGTSGATATITTANTGTNVSHNRDLGAVILQVGALNGDQAVRTTHRYIPYIPGKSDLITLTFLFGTAVADVRRRVGYFDTLNGLLLEQLGTTDVAFVRRSSTSGSPVDDGTVQANWNMDTMGAGSLNPSGITLDLSKTQFLVIDFVWQGNGRIRWGFMIGGKVIYCHQQCFANSEETTFMSTASLPVRFEITNTAATAGTNTMQEICTSVVSEGGERLTGLGFSVSTEITPKAVTTDAPVLVIRLKDTFGSDNGPNRKTAKFSSMSAMCTTNNAHFDLRHVHDPSSITGTFTSVADDSALEFSTDLSAYTPNPEHTIEQDFIVAGQAGKGASANDITPDEDDQHRLLSQNVTSDNSEMFVGAAESFTGTSNVSMQIGWVEFD